MLNTIKACLLVVFFMFTAACSRTDSNLNVEQAHNLQAQHILAPGMGTIGLIQNQQVYVYYLNEQHQWILDKTSQFNIPDDNNGLIALGMGNLGVVGDDQISVYRLDQENKWMQEEKYSFTLPRRYKRMLAVKMPWEMGVLAFEMNGRLEFYYYDEQNNWNHDETASFIIPDGIDDYFSMGNMTIAVIHENKLGLYYLHPEGDWRFLDQDHLVLKLPEDQQGVIPFEPGTIALLRDNQLNFYMLNTDEKRWVMDPAMSFYFAE